MGLFTAANPWLGLCLAFFASVGFTGSIVFYNSFLPVIAPPEMQDRLSARGFSLGYFGSALLLIICLILVQMPQTFGFTDEGIASRFSFLVTGIWWLGFGLPAINRLPKDEVKDYFEGKLFWKSWSELLLVFKEFRGIKSLRIFLGGFFLVQRRYANHYSTRSSFWIKGFRPSIFTAYYDHFDHSIRCYSRFRSFCALE